MPETYTDQPQLGERFDRALLLASEHHRTQLRKGTEIPYVAHLLGVSSLVLEMGGSETEAIGALLHDAVEDGGGPPMLERIRRSSATTPRGSWTRTPTPTRSPSRRGCAASRTTSRPSPTRRPTSCASRSPTSSTTPARSCSTTGPSATSCGAASGPAQGESIRWYYRSLYEAFDARRDALGPRAVPALEELGRTIDEIDRLATPEPGASRAPR